MLCGTSVYPPDSLTGALGWAGHYKGLEWSEADQKYVENPNLGILVEVDVSLVTPSTVSVRRDTSSLCIY